MSSGKWRPFCLGLNVLRLVMLNFHPLNRNIGTNTSNVYTAALVNFAHDSRFVLFYFDVQEDFTHIPQGYFTGTWGKHTISSAPVKKP